MVVVSPGVGSRTQSGKPDVPLRAVTGGCTTLRREERRARCCRERACFSRLAAAKRASERTARGFFRAPSARIERAVRAPDRSRWWLAMSRARIGLWAALAHFSDSRSADFRDLACFQGTRSRSARLKLDPAGGIKSLSAHPFFTRQVSRAGRQGAAKSLIILMAPRDSLICRYSSDQHRRSVPCSRSGEALQ